MQRTASAHWQGGLKDGRGTVSTASGVLSQTQYSFSTRFENGVGTNPEELIAAAHAGCFSMALSAQLDGAGLKADAIDTKALLTFEKVGDRLHHHQNSSGAARQGSQRQRRSVPEGRGRRQGRLPGLSRTQGGDHAGRAAGLNLHAAIPECGKTDAAKRDPAAAGSRLVFPANVPDVVFIQVTS